MGHDQGVLQKEQTPILVCPANYGRITILGACRCRHAGSGHRASCWFVDICSRFECCHEGSGNSRRANRLETFDEETHYEVI